MQREHWHPDENGMVCLRVQGREEMVAVSRLDDIREGRACARFYTEFCAAWDIDLDPSYGVSDFPKTGRAKPSRKQSARKAAAAKAPPAEQLGLAA